METYYKTLEETKDINMALSRTKINCELVKKNFSVREIEDDYITYLRAILWNHIIQSYHRKYGIDLYAEYACEIYGYFVDIVSGTKERKKCVSLTSGTLRFDLQKKELTVINIYNQNKDIFLTIIESIKFFEAEIISKLEEDELKYRHDYIYENIYQVLTVALCMKKIKFFINGIEYENKFPLKIKNQAYNNYISLIGENVDLTYYINKNTGEFIVDNGIKIEYKDWCNGKINDGVMFISKIIEDRDLPLFLRFSVGGFSGPSYSVNINFVKNECVYRSFKSGFEEDRKDIIKMETVKINRLISKMNKYTSEWKRDYKCEEIIMDGTSWSIEYITSLAEVKSSGSNAYPDNFNRFCKEIRYLTGRKFS